MSSHQPTHELLAGPMIKEEEKKKKEKEERFNVSHGMGQPFVSAFGSRPKVNSDREVNCQRLKLGIYKLLQEIEDLKGDLLSDFTEIPLHGDESSVFIGVGY